VARRRRRDRRRPGAPDPALRGDPQRLGAAGGASSAAGDPVAADAPPASATIPATLANRAVWLQIAAFFTVTGLEATAGQWSFTLLTESRGLGTAAAGAWVGAFWTAFTLGRVAAGVVVDRVGAVRLTRLAALASVAGALLFAAAPVPPSAAPASS
jgi:fucose permease